MINLFVLCFYIDKYHTELLLGTLNISSPKTVCLLPIIMKSINVHESLTEDWCERRGPRGDLEADCRRQGSRWTSCGTTSVLLL